MFEGIRFLSYEGNFGISEVRTDARYEKMLAQYRMEHMDHADYRIDGKSQYLLPRPMTEEQKEHLMHLQSFCYMTVGEGYYTQRSDYASFLLMYTYQGSGMLEYEGKSHCLHKNDIFLIDCRKKHAYRTAGEGWSHSDLHFFGGISEYFYQENFGRKEPVFHCSQPADYQKQLEKLLRIHTGSDARRDFVCSHELEHLLLKILDYGEGAQPSDGMPENIRLLVGYMEQHFRENISLEELARFAGMSKYYLCRLFKQYTGFAPMEYMIRLRLLQAEALLRGTELPSYKIGILSGFPNEANFIRHFKQKNGVTPGEYRR